MQVGCKHRIVFSVAVLCVLVLASVTGFATLGEDVSSIRSDQLRSNAQLRIVTGQAYSVHELQTPAGTVIREFVSPAGVVFGVTWQGPFSPDLRQLLGRHFDEYVQASQAGATHGPHHVHIETDDLVVEANGHMRFVVGRAYLRSQLPTGVSPDDLR